MVFFKNVALNVSNLPWCPIHSTWLVLFGFVKIKKYYYSFTLFIFSLNELLHVLSISINVNNVHGDISVFVILFPMEPHAHSVTLSKRINMK